MSRSNTHVLEHYFELLDCFLGFLYNHCPISQSFGQSSNVPFSTSLASFGVNSIRVVVKGILSVGPNIIGKKTAAEVALLISITLIGSLGSASDAEVIYATPLIVSSTLLWIVERQLFADKSLQEIRATHFKGDIGVPPILQLFFTQSGND
jgi:hypothetical protein